ncbi:conserved exported hypothetical protein [uncultured Sporomusa sp.]|uniref:Uncharacterized protein n=1 Tax=uncultured Sporomusa sp. TaxID=307249 RepID=A0A212LMF5_9FIRM|nr:hypothetical protein [uncultured Sporomusa sp.]SCM78715.1 conserved exported hypothetical protein [uncultured Sporomusa sp.]
MRHFFSFRRVMSAMLGVVLAVLLVVPCVQAETRTLPKDTKLHPQGWTVGDKVEFKKGTVLTTNDLGEVTSGTLKDDIFLQPRGWERVINDYYYVSAYAVGSFFPRFHRSFIERSYNMAIPGYGHLRYKGGTPVTFSEQGEVLRGTLAEQATVRLVAGKYGFLTLRENTVLAFYDSGAIRSGVLAEDTHLRPVGWRTNLAANDSAGFVKFSAKQAIEFDENGEVTVGTLKEKVTWRSTAGEVVEFPANTVVRFNDEGALVIKTAI